MLMSIIDEVGSKRTEESQQDLEEVKKKNVALIEKLTHYAKNLKFSDTREFIAFLRDLVLLVIGSIQLTHFIMAGVPLGGRLKLVQPRNTYVRTDKPVFLTFEYAIEGRLIRDTCNYEISLREVDGDTLWGPFEVSKAIDPKVDVEDRNTKKYAVITHLLDYRLLKSDKEYKWTVETEEEARSAIFKVLKKEDLVLLTEVERQVEELSEKDFLLGVLYERMGLFDDAIEKYKSVVTNDPSLVIALPRISAVYAKKASKFFIKEVDITKLSGEHIARDDVDLAKEADYWTRSWKDPFNQLIEDMVKEANNRTRAEK